MPTADTVVDAKLVSAAFRAARVGEGRPDKVGNHWAAFSKNLARLAAEPAALPDDGARRALVMNTGTDNAHVDPAVRFAFSNWNSCTSNARARIQGHMSLYSAGCVQLRHVVWRVGSPRSRGARTPHDLLINPRGFNWIGRRTVTLRTGPPLARTTATSVLSP